MNKLWIVAVVVLVGCSMTDEEVKETAGNAAVKVKKASEYTAEQLRTGYNDALGQGRKIVADVSEKMSDATLKAKVLAGFKLIKGLDASNVNVTVKNGIVTLTGTVPTELDRMKAEGVAYGVTGGGTNVRSSLTVPK